MGGEAEHLKLLEERQLLRHRRHRKPELHEAVRLEAPGAGSIPLVHICYCIAVGLESKVGLTRHTRSARSRPPTTNICTTMLSLLENPPDVIYSAR